MALTWSFSNEEISSTAFNYLISERQTSVRDRPYRVTEAIMGSTGEPAEGYTATIPWEVDEHSNITQMSTGYEDIDLTARPTLTSGRDQYFLAVMPILYSWRDEKANSGKLQRMNQVKSRTRRVDRAMAKAFELQVLQANQTTMSDLNSWNGDDDANGFFEAAAVGSQNNIVHETSKATYSDLPGFQNLFGDIGGSFSTNGLDVVELQLIKLRERAENLSKMHNFCSINFAANYAKAIRAGSTFGAAYMRKDGNDALGAADGNKIVISGMEYVITSSMPNAGTATGVTDKEWSLISVEAECTAFSVFGGADFNMTPFRDLSGNDVKMALMRIAGQNFCRSWKGALLIIGGDTWA